jgi:HD-GYP domain-containing protein (c-di-GMP phosphodiesterase class II)
MLMDNEESFAKFQRIDFEVLDIEQLIDFDVFVKTSATEKEPYIKYYDRNRSDQKDKLLGLLNSQQIQTDLYIQSINLKNYYEHASQSMREYLSNPKVEITQKFQKVYVLANNLTKSFFEDKASPNILKSSPEVIELLKSCLENEELIDKGLQKLVSKDYRTYTHSINVGLYCMAYGIKSGFPSDRVSELGLGGMLHDVGQIKIDDNITNKPDRLNDDEFGAIKKHTQYGKSILEKLECFDGNIIQIVEQHHENCDGSGYPEGIKGDQISNFTKICAIADIYDTLVSYRNYGKQEEPFDAFNLIKEENKNQFDKDIFVNFVRLMGPDT